MPLPSLPGIDPGYHTPRVCDTGRDAIGYDSYSHWSSTHYRLGIPLMIRQELLRLGFLPRLVQRLGRPAFSMLGSGSRWYRVKKGSRQQMPGWSILLVGLFPPSPEVESCEPYPSWSSQVPSLIRSEAIIHSSPGKSCMKFRRRTRLARAKETTRAG